MAFLTVAAGNGFAIGIVEPASLVIWGANTAMKAKFVPSESAKAVFAGTDIAFFIAQDGRLNGFGSTEHDRLPIPYDIPNAKHVVIGPDYVIALEASGSLKAWGTGLGATLPPGVFNQSVQSITGTGTEFSALLTNGTIVQWGLTA